MAGFKAAYDIVEDRMAPYRYPGTLRAGGSGSRDPRWSAAEADYARSVSGPYMFTGDHPPRAGTQGNPGGIMASPMPSPPKQSAGSRWMRGAKKKAQRAALQNKIRNAERKLNRATDELNRGMLKFGRGVEEAQRMATDFADSLVPPRSFPAPSPGRAAANRPVTDYRPPVEDRGAMPITRGADLRRQPQPNELPSRPMSGMGHPGILREFEEYHRQRAMPLPQSHTSPRTPYDPQPAPYIPPGGGYSIPVPWQR